ncbi:CoA transferase [Pseudorhodoplanes sp.]|uniref:CaiB/BaiF CoA-transferase family protein n=1 Tax=Pseudorhodoplanes sp. TaxID=1934341 RepID=UPI0039191AFF
MKSVADALQDVIVTEEIAAATPFWAVLAIGLAGRLAADFGARVIRVCCDADPLGDFPADPDAVLATAHRDALRNFLCAGKQLSSNSAPTNLGPYADRGVHIRMRYAHDEPAHRGMLAALCKDVVFSEEAANAEAASRAASEFTIAARSGLLDIVGRSDARPLMIGGHQIAYSTGLSGFLAMAALLHDPQLARADVSALGTAFWINWKSLAAAAQGRAVPRRNAERGKWRTAPCADGHVALIYFDRDWPQIAKMTGDPQMQALAAARGWTDRDTLNELERGLEAWTAHHTRRDIAAASKAFGLAFGPVWTPAELRDDPQYRTRNFFAPAAGNGSAAPFLRPPVVVAAQADAAGPARRGRRAGGSGPLSGIRVIDLGILTAGASTSAILADLGADVIKVESPTYLDPFRGTPGTSRAEGWWNKSDAFKSTNRNKRAICLDLKAPRGRDVFLALCRQSDVVIENFRRGVMRRLGIGYDALRAANPGLVLASVSSQGEDGPDADTISFGSTLEAMSGLAALTAYEDGMPLVTGMDLNYPDQVGSVFAAAAIIAALRSTLRTGTGAHLDISQRELATFLLGEQVLAAGDVAPCLGNASPDYFLQDAFAAKDGWVAVSIKDAQQWAAVLAVSAADEKPAAADAGSCKALLTTWMSERDVETVCALLDGIGVAAAPVLDGQGALAYAQRLANDAIRPLATSPAGDIVKGFPLHFPERPIEVRCAAPDLGQHTGDVLRERLGLSDSEIDELMRDNVIGTRPASPNASRLD